MAVAFAIDPIRAEVSQPPFRLGPYALLDCLAQGGMASVFRGLDTQTGELVAVKTVRNATAREIAGLDREIETLRGLKHPGVVRFVAAGRWDQKPWMAIELLRGRTLFREIASMWRGDSAETSARTGNTDAETASDGADAGWLRRLQDEMALAGPQRPAAAGRLREAVSVVVRLARVLAYVHDRGVVHRDLKPENIFLRDDGRITLLDFGLSCRARSRVLAGESKGSRLATVEYAAPELLRGESVDARSDIYSLGCILDELVTGARPFDGETTGDIVRMHLSGDPVCPSDRVAGLSGRMNDLILDLLAKQPKRRPRTAADVAGRLTEAYLDGVALDGAN